MPSLSDEAERTRRRDRRGLIRDASLTNPTDRPLYSSAASRAAAEDKADEASTRTGVVFQQDRLGPVVTGNSGILNSSREEEIVFQAEEETSSQASSEALQRQAPFVDNEDRPDKDEENSQGDEENSQGDESGSDNDTSIMANDVAALDEHLITLLNTTEVAEINNNKTDSPLLISMVFNGYVKL